MKITKLTILLALLMSMVTSVALAQTVVEIGGLYYSLNGSTAEVTYGDDYYSGDVTIPSSVTYNGTEYSVTSIGFYAFWSCIGLTSITIPNSVTSIGFYAFQYCSSLTSIEIPSSVTSIGRGTFGGCSSLTSIIVEAGNSIYDSRNNCHAIIETATNTLVAGCQNTIIPNSVTRIGDSAFNGCRSLASIEIPNSVTYIGGYAFWSCNSLTSILVEADNPVYDSRDNCNAIIETATNMLVAGCQNTIIPNSVTSIGVGAFYGCTGLTSIEIPNSVESIGFYAFGYCRGLTDVTIGKSVKYIDEGAFAGCSGLIDIYCFATDIPSTGYSVFLDVPTSSATLHVPTASIEAYKTTSPWSEFGTIVEIEDDELESAKEELMGMLSYFMYHLYISRQTLSEKATSDEAPKLYQQVDDIAARLDYARYQLDQVTSMEGIQDLKAMMEDIMMLLDDLRNQIEAFEVAQTFTATTIEGVEMTFKIISEKEKTAVVSTGKEDVPTIPVSTTGTVTIPQVANGYHIVGVDEEAFRNTCPSTVIIPVGITFIGEKAFMRCPNLSSVTLPDGVITIGEEAFSESPLSSVSLPTSLVRIGEQAFEGTSLTSVTLPQNVAYLGNADREDEWGLVEEDDLYGDVFNGCSLLREVNVDPANTVYASVNGILMTKDLKTLLYFPQAKSDNTIPSGVEVIYCDAFADCTFDSITLPASIIDIREDAFDDCIHLTSIFSKIKEPFSIDTWCFSGIVYEQATLYVPYGTKAIYEATEGWNKFQNIVEMENFDIEPLEDGEVINFADFMDESGVQVLSDLDGKTVGDLFFNILNDNGGYDAEEGCIVITESTDDDIIDRIAGKDFYDRELRETFTGIIFKVPAGSGDIKITADALGSMFLKVRIGDDKPQSFELDSHQKVKIPYTVDKETLVYVYASEDAGSQEVKGVKGVASATSSSSMLRIYGIESEIVASAITGMEANSDAVTIYSISGQRLSKPQKGINIINGKKVLLK